MGFKTNLGGDNLSSYVNYSSILEELLYSYLLGRIRTKIAVGENNE